jgi:MYXO-CTERM domain-containing protein
MRIASATVIVAMLACAGAANAQLIAYFPFTGGSVGDASGNGVYATNNGATLVSGGIAGDALSFNGSSNFVNVNLDINPSARPLLTMGAWVRPASGNSSVHQIISHDNFGFDRSLCIDFRGGGGSSWSSFTGQGILASGVAPVVDQWVFLAVVYNQTAGTMRLHVDGQVFSRTTNFNPGQTILNIGRNPNGNGEHFRGLIDEVFFINGELSTDQVENIRVNGVPTPGAAGLLAAAGLVATRRRRR